MPRMTLHHCSSAPLYPCTCTAIADVGNYPERFQREVREYQGRVRFNPQHRPITIEEYHRETWRDGTRFFFYRKAGVPKPVNKAFT